MSIPSTCPTCGSGDIRPIDGHPQDWFCGQCSGRLLRIYSLSRRSWWRDEALGYTDDRDGAGLFTPLAAARHVAMSYDSVACALDFEPARFLPSVRAKVGGRA